VDANILAILDQQVGAVLPAPTSLHDDVCFRPGGFDIQLLGIKSRLWAAIVASSSVAITMALTRLPGSLIRKRLAMKARLVFLRWHHAFPDTVRSRGACIRPEFARTCTQEKETAGRGISPIMNVQMGAEGRAREC
jgi:hypothetical protein